MKINHEYNIFIFNEDLQTPNHFLWNASFNYDGLKDSLKQAYRRAVGSSGNRERFDSFMNELAVQMNDKMAVIARFNALRLPISPYVEHIQKSIGQRNLRSEILSDKAVIVVPLYIFMRHLLRTLFIHRYFADCIAPQISETYRVAFEGRYGKNHQSNPKYGYGYLYGFKKRILGEYSDSPLFWIRLNQNDKSLKLIDESFGSKAVRSQNKKLKVFQPASEFNVATASRYYSEARFIDIFTPDEETTLLIKLTADPEDLAFAEELTPLVQELKEIDLLHALELNYVK